MLKSLFAFGIQEGIMSVNPIKNDMQQKDTSNRLPFNEEQINRLIIDLARNNNIIASLLVEFIKITGMRINEVISIRLADIDEKFIQIHGKGDRTRYFPIFHFPEIYDVIERAKKFSKHDLLFGLKSYARQQQYIRASRERLGFDVEYANFHAIRKYAENNMLFNLNIPNKVVLSIIGHTKDVQEKSYLLKLQRNEIENLLTNKKII
jgi:integrase